MNAITNHSLAILTVFQAFWHRGQVFFFWVVQRLMQCVWQAWLQAPQLIIHASLSDIQLAWHSRQVSFMLFLQIAQFSTATFQLHRATAFHCLTSMRLSISIVITQCKNYIQNLSKWGEIQIVVDEKTMICFCKVCIYLNFACNQAYKIMTQSFVRTNLNAGSPRYQGLQGCALDTSASKKRLFVRKPGVATPLSQAEKPKKLCTQGAEKYETWRQALLCQQNQQPKPRQVPKTTKDPKNAQNSKKESVLTNPLLSPKQLQPSKSKSQLDLLAGLKYIHANSTKTKIQAELVKDKSPMPRDYLGRDYHFALDDTTDNSLQSEGNCKKTISLKNIEKEVGQLTSEIGENLPISEDTLNSIDSATRSEDPCIYCCTMRKTNEIFQQKISKLQQQLFNRQQQIKVLSQRLENLRVQTQLSTNQQLTLRQENYAREMQIYLQCSARYESARKQLSRVAERLKYLEIQNGVLARYKQDCNEAKKDYERVRQENDNLKKQIKSICKMRQKYNQDKKLVGLQLHRQKEYLPGKAGNNRAQREEDTISLELSELSYQHL